MTQQEKKSPMQNAQRRHSIDSSTLFNSSKNLFIHHDKHVYELRITRSNKLILTKAEPEVEQQST